MNQIDLHNKIDEILTKTPDDQSSTIEIHSIIQTNSDAKNYFYAKADERWLGWLWSKGLLDEIRKKTDSTEHFSNRMPELDYLDRMAESVPDKVAKIILSTSNTGDAFNPRIVDRFLWICSKFPAPQLAMVAKKIHDENWVRLMRKSDRWGFEYEKILKTLNESKDYDNLLLIAEEVLSIRKKEEFEEDENGISRDNPFYLSDPAHTKIFEYLASSDDEHIEAALGLTVRAIADIALLGGSSNGESIFKIAETFHLYDIDFFTVELGQRGHLSYRDDVVELAALAKVLTARMIGRKCAKDESETRRIYERYITNLPDSRSMYRLRLYALSLCPKLFKSEIKSALFRIFDYDDSHELVMGPEYKRIVKIGFSTLSELERREYVTKVISLYAKEERSKFVGVQILSSVYPSLTEKEKLEATTSLGSLDPTYEPWPLISSSRGGMVIPQSPGIEEDWNKPIPDIIEKFKHDWSPDLLKEDLNEDFLRPKNAQGVGDRLKVEMEKHPTEYLDKAGSFFDRESLHPHYTYSYLRGIVDLFRGGKLPKGSDLSQVLRLMEAVAQSGLGDPYVESLKNRGASGWLASWNAVHGAMADVLQQLLTGESQKLLIDFGTSRDALFTLVKYLLNHPDPTPKDEQLETAKSKVKAPGDQDYLVADPYTTAINSVRGQAFEALILFVFQDGKRLDAGGKKISEDVKLLYEEVLKKENTQALMFMFGRSIPTFYYRDRAWLRGLLSSIFSPDPTKEHLYLAAWEGYLSNNLYQEIFFDQDFQNLYQRAIKLSPENFPERRYFRDLDEGLGNHLALAFMYYDDFGFESQLFKDFWQQPSNERHGEFIGFIGGMFVSGSNTQADVYLRENPNAQSKLKDFWDWTIKYCGEPEALVRFGFWMNLDKKIFDLPWLAERIQKTLEKTNGEVDWDYGLMRAIPKLAAAAPEATLNILRLHILEGGIRRKGFFLQSEWLKSFRILYENPLTRSGTYELIDDLIREGGSHFWPLEEIVKKQ